MFTKDNPPPGRPPMYHHFWCLLSSAPPLRGHKETSKSPLVKWLSDKSGVDLEVARAAIDSAQQAKYLRKADGIHWTYDAEYGFHHWNSKQTQFESVNNQF